MDGLNRLLDGDEPLFDRIFGPPPWAKRSRPRRPVPTCPRVVYEGPLLVASSGAVRIGGVDLAQAIVAAQLAGEDAPPGYYRITVERLGDAP